MARRDLFDLTDRLALVTGGAGWIGAAICARLAEYGAHVAIADTRLERAAEVAAEITADGGRASAFAVDVRDEGSVDALFAAVAGELGPVRILVNGAAPLGVIRTERPVDELAVETWDTIMDVALRGTALCCRALLRQESSAGAVIVNVSSIHAYAADPVLSAYPAAKAGVLALTRSVAAQHGARGVRCNAVSPGAVPHADASQELLDVRLRSQLLHRRGEPDDIAAVVLFLAADASSFVTGQGLLADGGLLARLPWT